MVFIEFAEYFQCTLVRNIYIYIINIQLSSSLSAACLGPENPSIEEIYQICNIFKYFICRLLVGLDAG